MYKIYKIVDNTNNNVYIGQTEQKYLSQRMKVHRYFYKNNLYYSSSKILKNNDWFYELIEETDDKSREEYWIKNTENCINDIKYKRYTKKEEYQNALLKDKNYNKKRYERNKVNVKLSRKKNYEFKKSWGGDPRSHNNLLNIDVDLFN